MSAARLQVGTSYQPIAPAHLPPLGARITVHGDLTEDRISRVVEVTDHEWNLEPHSGYPDEPGGLSTLTVWIKTRPVN